MHLPPVWPVRRDGLAARLTLEDLDDSGTVSRLRADAGSPSIAPGNALASLLISLPSGMAGATGSFFSSPTRP